MVLCIHTKIIPGPTKICRWLVLSNYVAYGIVFHSSYATLRHIMSYELYNNPTDNFIELLLLKLKIHL